MVVLNLWLSRSYGCPHLMVVHILWLSETPVCNLSYLMVVHILWLSISYDCPDLMIVQYSCMLYFRSYGCPHLMVVQYKLISYGFILWYLMVVFWKKDLMVWSYGCPCWWLSCWWLSSNQEGYMFQIICQAKLLNWARWGCKPSGMIPSSLF